MNGATSNNVNATPLDNASPTFLPAPRAHLCARHVHGGLHPAAVCILCDADADVTLDRAGITTTTAADGLVSVERSFITSATLGLAAYVINAHPIYAAPCAGKN
ncbi:Hypothetical predicted protein [Cloeon dipterum]|uniref:Uncharacterized protein n=1 Tax=Cloeon dipterum TaxID=197152 RepID=A0A8S1DHK5_9INSE|nr:Hypothetical predicted protein [Cloeon dipterum]